MAHPTAWHGLHVVLLWRGDLVDTWTLRRRRALTVGPKGWLVLPEEAVGDACLPVITPIAGGVGLHAGVADRALMRIDGRDLVATALQHAATVHGGAVPLPPGARVRLQLGAFTLVISHAEAPVRFARGWLGDDAPRLVGCVLAATALTVAPLLVGPGAGKAAPWSPPPRPVVVEAAPIAPSPPTQVADIGSGTLTPPPLAPIVVERPEPRPDPSPSRAARADEEPRDPLALKVLEVLAQKSEAARRAARRRLIASVANDAAEDVLNAAAGAAGPRTRLAAQAGDDEDHAPGALPRVLLGAAPPPSRRPQPELRRRERPAVLARKQRVVPKVRLKARPQRLRVVARPAQVSGGRDPADIQRTLRRRRGALVACYQRGVQRDPGLGGKLVAELLITPAGQVRARVRGQLDADVDACVLRVLRGLRFSPEASGGTTRVVYPVRFSARGPR